MRHITRITPAVLLAIFACVLAGCPRFADVIVFNHSDREVRLIANGEDLGSIAQGSELKFRFTGEAFDIQHGADQWIFARQIPLRGEEGPFFDGTLRLQLESDGSLYVLKKGDIAPVDPLPEQPHGFPLKPKT